MTIIPCMDCICHEETCDVVQMTLDALAHTLHQHHDLNLVDLVGEWFWDGTPGAMTMSTYFPSLNGQLCLEHAKRHTEKRFSGGLRKLTKNFKEFSAFLTPPVFDIATIRPNEKCNH